MVLDVLRDAVDFEFGLMDLYLRVGAGDGVDLACLLLLFEHRPFAHAD